MSSWSDQPGYNEVRETLRNRASSQAQCRMIELQIQLLEATVGKEKPRDPSARIIGHNEETGKRLVELRTALASARNELDRLDAEIKFLDYWKEIYKSVAYRERL